MANVTGVSDGLQAVKGLGTNKVRAEVLVDFGTYNANSGDVVYAVPIAADTLVTDVWSIIKTAEGGAGTMNIGDGSNRDGWDAAVNANAAAATVVKGDGAYAGGKLYTAADYIDIEPTATLDNAEVILIVEMCAVENYS